MKENKINNGNKDEICIYISDDGMEFDDEISCTKKPVEQGDGINYNCPICGGYVGYVDAMAWETPKYCDECGHKLDWSGK